jgi:hypothetical protein
MKIRTVTTAGEVDQIVLPIAASAKAALSQLQRLCSMDDALKALWEMKVSPAGCDPLDAAVPLNLIEQLNQTFTYVASARAVKILLERHPRAAPFTLNLGTAAGSDIESKLAGGIAAEVFAAVNTANNRKLSKDVKKVAATKAQFKYVFFMCPGYAEGRQTRLERVPGVEVWSVGTG